MGSRAKSPTPRIEPPEEPVPSEQTLAEYQAAWEDEVSRLAEEQAEAVPSEQELAENEAAWEEEVLRIAKEHEEGRAESIPWEQVRAQLFGERS
ncbi:hypothetical protein OV079_34335 [Nannocystis pusilla]|uniref:Addiction module protein n=1 Tax=Nannocystis pusilla TaxID=889268 RepID=A0A9X3IZF1_9BACT|nr:hypothetical protein [Nannocystis pusilla]MCY1010557.1 hypothetical protein [Nannocystis pusilla]